MRYGRKLSAVTKDGKSICAREENTAVCRGLGGRGSAGEARAPFEIKLTWNYQDVSVLLPVVGPVPTGAVSDREARGLLADLLVLALILVHLGYRVLHALLLQPLRQLRHREPRCAAHHILLQCVVDEFVLFLCDG